MQRRRRGLRWAALVAAGGLVVTACGSSGKASTSSTGATSVPPAGGSSTTVSPTGTGGGGASETIGLTRTTINIGQIATISGPVPGLFQNARDSLEAFVAYQNSIGGVDGRQLKLNFDDDALSCTNYTNDINGLAKSTFAIVGTFSIVDSCGQKTLDANPNFPDVQAYLFSPPLYNTRNALTPTPQPPGYSTTAATWIKGKFPNAITHTGALYTGTAKSSFNSISSAFESVGYKYVYSRATGLTETNFTSDVLRMKAAGIQVVDLYGESVNTDADFIREADQQNFHPDAIIAPTAYDASFFKLSGGVSATDVYMPLLYPLYLGEDRGTNPALNTYLTWLGKTHPGESANIYGIEAWASGVLFVQALKAAGGSPNRDAVINQINKISNFSANGLLPPTNPAAKQGATCIVVIQISGQKYVRVDPPTQGFECNGTYHHITEAQAAA